MGLEGKLIMRIIITDDKLRHKEVLVTKNPYTDKAQNIYIYIHL